MAFSYYYTVTDESGNTVTDLTSYTGSGSQSYSKTKAGNTALAETYDIEVFASTSSSSTYLTGFELSFDASSFFTGGSLSFGSLFDFSASNFTNAAAGSATIAASSGDGDLGINDTVGSLFTISNATITSDALSGVFDLGLSINQSQTVLTDTSSMTGSDANNYSLIDISTASTSATDSGTYDMSASAAQVDLQEITTVYGTTLDIGSSDFTNMVRIGDTISGTTHYANLGTAGLSTSDLTLTSQDTTLSGINWTANTSGDIFAGYNFDGSSSLQMDLSGDDAAAVSVSYSTLVNSATAGENLDLLDISYSGNESATITEGDSQYAALVTYQGDLNYDGMVSMQDLAFLNAGAAKVAAGGSVSGQVDADHNGTINLEDLTFVNTDWDSSIWDTTLDTAVDGNTYDAATYTTLTGTSGRGTLSFNISDNYSNTALDAVADNDLFSTVAGSSAFDPGSTPFV